MTNSPPIEDAHFADAPSVEEVPGPRSQELLERQREIDSNAITYPRTVPVALSEGRGATVKDVDGNVFLDFFAGIGVLNVGHSNPYVLEAVQDQTEKLIHSIDFPTEARIDLIEKLNEIAPGTLAGNSKVVFGGPSGSDAIEGTLKLARYNTGGSGFIAFRGGYHGSTSGALSLTSKNGFKKDYAPLLADTVHLRYPYPFLQGKSDEEAVDEALYDVKTVLEDPYSGLANPAGVWVEPIQGEGGIVAPPEGFLSGLRELTEKHDIPLVVDEIQTGFGRTGEWFASEWYDLSPDIMPVAKALGGIGFPLSASVYHEDFDTWEAGGHVGTFRGHVPAMRAGVRAIEYIQDHDLLAHARDLGEYIRSRLTAVAEDNPCIGEVRGKGLFIGVEFITEDGESNKQAVQDIQMECYQQGVLVWTAGRRGNVLRLIPPLVLTQQQAENGLDIITEAIETVTKASPLTSD